MTSTTGDDKASPEAGILRTFEKATSIHQFCPNHAWASLPGKEKILPLLFSFEDPKIEQLFFGIGEYLFLWERQTRSMYCQFLRVIAMNYEDVSCFPIVDHSDKSRSCLKTCALFNWNKATFFFDTHEKSLVLIRAWTYISPQSSRKNSKFQSGKWFQPTFFNTQCDTFTAHFNDCSIKSIVYAFSSAWLNYSYWTVMCQSLVLSDASSQGLQPSQQHSVRYFGVDVVVKRLVDCARCHDLKEH